MFLLKFISNIVSFLSIYIHLCLKVDFNMCEHFCSSYFYFAHHFISFTWVCTLCCAAGDEIYSNDSVHYHALDPASAKKAAPEARFRFAKRILMKHFPFIHWVSFIGWCRRTHTQEIHTFFGTLMMPLNLYSLYPAARAHALCWKAHILIQSAFTIRFYVRTSI